MRVTGDWGKDQALAFMADSIIPLRLAALDGAGFPVNISLWFLPEDGALWCATNRRAKLVTYLGQNPRVSIEVAADAPPYRGVRGQGMASLHPDQGWTMLDRLLTRYRISRSSQLARMLTAKADQEVAIRIAPTRLSSWDFSTRMVDAVAA